MSGATKKQTPETNQRKLAIDNNIIQSQDLFDKSGVIKIQHGDKAYQLRLTRFNKLILTC